MAKDPAFNFYTNDFDSKTKFFTHEQVGMYLRLLMAQHQHGHLSDKQMLHVCGRYDKDVFSKFTKDENGHYYNERLEMEVGKRRAYSESRRNNRKSHKSQNTSNTHVNHVSSHMENEYEKENEIINKKESDENHVSREPSQHDFTKPDVDGDEIIFPIDTQSARELWANWKKYRWREHGERYGMYGEQSALKRLERMTFAQMEETILTAIAGKWKNLYPEKQNGKQITNTNKKQQQSDNTKEYLSDYYAEKLGKSQAK